MLPESMAELIATRRTPEGPYLEVLGGPEDGRICSTKDKTTRIGRSSDNDLDLGLDPSVSRTHASIEQRDGGFFLKDVGSRGGTSVDGRPVQGEVQLRGGQVIEVGQTALLFHLDKGDGAE